MENDEKGLYTIAAPEAWRNLPTPRTDSAIMTYATEWDGPKGLMRDEVEYVEPSIARELERELANMRATSQAFRAHFLKNCPIAFDIPDAVYVPWLDAMEGGK